MSLCSHILKQGCTNPGHQFGWVTKFCMVVPIICEFSVQNLLYITLLAPSILRWLLGFWKICASLFLKRQIVFHKAQKSIQLRWAM